LYSINEDFKPQLNLSDISNSTCIDRNTYNIKVVEKWIQNFKGLRDMVSILIYLFANIITIHSFLQNWNP